MKRNSLIFNSILAVSIIFGSLLYHSCSKEESSIQNVEENQIELPYNKTINLTDQHGNTLSFDLYSDDQILLNSYSEKNFTFTGMTKEDIILQYEIDVNNNIEGGDEEEYIDENEISITIAQKNVEVNLKTGFVGYSLEEKWEAPEEIEDRGFDWHDQISQYDYARVRNNRCCWSIYSTWRWGNAWNGPWNNITVGLKIKGGSTSLRYGKASSNYIKLSIRYRKASHRTIYYSN